MTVISHRFPKYTNSKSNGQAKTKERQRAIQDKKQSANRKEHRNLWTPHPLNTHQPSMMNCRGLKANINELFVLGTNQLPAVIYFEET